MIINPSSLKKIALAIHKDPYFYSQNFSYVPFLNVFKNLIDKQLVKVYTPSFDFFDKGQKGSLEQTANNENNYYLGMINSLTLSQIDLFRPVNTYTYSDFLSIVTNNNVKTSGNLKFTVLIPYQENDQNSYFQELMWRLAIFQFVPFFLNTNVYPKNLGGPLFVESFSISCSSSDVVVDVDFTGGSQILPPEILPEYNESEYRQTYRTAKNYDCVLSLNVTQNSSNIYDSTASLNNYSVAEGINIRSMSLKINTPFTKIFTANDGVQKFTSDGMKFLSYSKRTVSGSFSFIASENLTIYFASGTNKQIIMYFGGPFYFPMNNVTIQSFDVSLDSAQNTFIHNVKFVALLQPTESTAYYLQNEFDINRDALYNQVSATVYTKPQ